MLKNRFLILCLMGLSLNSKAFAQDAYALDDAHNHDGTHVEGQVNCGTNYMFPNDIARLGSHSFIILGQDGENHILADHRSGTPPHTYQFILRVRLDADEMALYKKLLKESKQIPAFTTIYYDDKDPKKQLDRTFFCLTDLPKIFGNEKKKGDPFDKLFPIRASLQKDADFEGAFEIQKSIYPGGHFTLERDDVELVVYRYLPSYLEQKSFRKAIVDNPKEMIPRLSHAPLYATEPIATASQRKSYARTDALISEPGVCPGDYYLKNVPLPKTIHIFLLMAEVDANTVLAVHYYDQAPQNFQAALRIKLSDEEMKVYREAKRGTKIPPMLQTREAFCMADLKKLITDGSFYFKGSVFKDSGLNDYKLGKKVGELEVKAQDVQVMTNRTLASLLNPNMVARDALGITELVHVDPNIQIEMRYATDWNFFGRVIPGYNANKCFLTRPAAQALAKVQKYVEQQGYSLLIFDCYRPQSTVTEFVKWTQDKNDIVAKGNFYPDQPKDKLIERGYIADKSGHSRASTIDLTLIKKSAAGKKQKLAYREEAGDCRKLKNITSTGQLDMGTPYDCFDVLANTDNPKISEEAKKNRQILKSAMEKFGFSNLKFEWWHYTLKNEPYKDKYFDFPVE